MATILKIAFLVCFTFVFLAPAGVRAIKCIHCVSQALNETEAENCIGPGNTKFQDTNCKQPNMICSVNDLTSDGKRSISRGCIFKPTIYSSPCCAMKEDTANAETNVKVSIPYLACSCDKDNCNSYSGTFSVDKLPNGFTACPVITGPDNVGGTGGAAPGPGPLLGAGGNNTAGNSQDIPRGSFLSVLGAICLTVFVVIPTVVSHDSLQY